MTPTVGRIVHFHPNTEKAQAALIIDTEPKAGPGHIALGVFSRDGGRWMAVLSDQPDTPDERGYYWTWPPKV